MVAYLTKSLSAKFTLFHLLFRRLPSISSAAVLNYGGLIAFHLLSRTSSHSKQGGKTGSLNSYLGIKWCGIAPNKVICIEAIETRIVISSLKFLINFVIIFAILPGCTVTPINKLSLCTLKSSIKIKKNFIVAMYCLTQFVKLSN